MKKALIIIAVIVVLGGVGAYFYVFHKPHRNVAEEEASLTETATTLVESFNSDAESAKAKFLDKVVQVEGVVSEIDAENLVLESGVVCGMDDPSSLEGLQEGDMVTVKGRVVTYDDLFGEVRMDFCQLDQ